MDWSNKQTNIHTNTAWRGFSVHRNVQGARFKQSNDYPKNDGNYKRDRHHKYFLAVILSVISPALVQQRVFAETVGGVSATASPIANSSGSVTNQAIQVLQGPYITNTYGNGIQCQGPTVNFTPYVTGSATVQKPYEPWYNDPVYDMRDLDEDGSLDNPGNILYHVPTRTGQKDNYSLGLGFSATWSRPLDKQLQDQCKAAAQANIDLMTQATANKRLDFEIARLKNCGELLKAGIRFAPGTKYASICADVQVLNKNTIAPHVHSIPSPSVSGSRVSESAADLGAPLGIRSSLASPAR